MPYFISAMSNELINTGVHYECGKIFTLARPFSGRNILVVTQTTHNANTSILHTLERAHKALAALDATTRYARTVRRANASKHFQARCSGAARRHRVTLERLKKN